MWLLMARRWLCLVLATIAFSTSVATACNIPVFRFALERWRQDAYEITVETDGEISPADAEFLKQLKLASQAAGGAQFAVGGGHSEEPRSTLTHGNFVLLHKMSDSPEGAKAKPSRITVTGTVGPRRVEFYSGTFEQARRDALLSSPVRDELTRRLLAGHAVVWLLVRSADAERSDEIRERLTETFAELERQIKLPDGIGLPGSELHSEVPLVVKFSVVEIDPSDSRESFFAGSLIGFREQSHRDGQPLLIPVFGRGRALEVIPADDVTDALVKDVSLFLSGACSCQVKEQNPGFDLLLSIDWDAKLFGDRGLRPPPAMSSGRPDDPPVYLTIPPGKRR